MRRKKKLYKQLNMIITSDHTHTHTHPPANKTSLKPKHPPSDSDPQHNPSNTPQTPPTLHLPLHDDPHSNSPVASIFAHLFLQTHPIYQHWHPSPTQPSPTHKSPHHLPVPIPDSQKHPFRCSQCCSQWSFHLVEAFLVELDHKGFVSLWK